MVITIFHIRAFLCYPFVVLSMGKEVYQVQQILELLWSTGLYSENTADKITRLTYGNHNLVEETKTLGHW